MTNKPIMHVSEKKPAANKKDSADFEVLEDIFDF